MLQIYIFNLNSLPSTRLLHPSSSENPIAVDYHLRPPPRPRRIRPLPFRSFQSSQTPVCVFISHQLVVSLIAFVSFLYGFHSGFGFGSRDENKPILRRYMCIVHVRFNMNITCGINMCGCSCCLMILYA